METIPFNRFGLVGNESRYMNESIQQRKICGNGQFTKRCQHLLENQLHVAKSLLTTSCTHALEMAAFLLDIHPGDEVIVPSFTFVSTINAFAIRGATPVFADIRSDTFNLDETQLERLISPRTKAIVVVHYGGVGCEMDSICQIAEKYGIAVVEDNAHGLFGKYKGRYLGTFGCLATQSFHETKNIVCGEGGALLINDLCYFERAEIIREKGTDRNRFFRGEVDKYTWVDLGSSYVPSEMVAAFLCAQLEAKDAIQRERRLIWHFYFEQLRDWAERHRVQLPFVPSYCDSSYHIFGMIFPSQNQGDAFITRLKSKGISAMGHYWPLHLSEKGRSYGGKDGDCPVAEAVSRCLVRLPIYYGLTQDEQYRIVEAIL